MMRRHGDSGASKVKWLAIAISILLFADAAVAEVSPKVSMPPFEKQDLPMNETPYHVLVSRVLPFFKTLANEKILIPAKVDTLYFHKLSPLGQKSLLGRLKLESIDSDKANEMLNLFAGQYINLKQRSSKIPIPKNSFEFSTRRTADVTRFTIFQKGAGLRLINPKVEPELLFLPIDNQDLRAYTGIAGADYEDKSYPTLQRKISSASPPIDTNVWLNVFSNGLNTDLFLKLPKDQQRLVLDTVGIYIAEYFRNVARNIKAGEKEYRPGVNFLSILLLERFLSAGGPVLYWYKDGDKENRTEPCIGTEIRRAGKTNWCIANVQMSFFQNTDYRYRRDIRIANESLKQRFYCKEKKDVCAKLDYALPPISPSYLDRLSILLQHEKPIPRQTIEALADYLEYTTRERDPLKRFIFETVSVAPPF